MKDFNVKGIIRSTTIGENDKVVFIQNQGSTSNLCHMTIFINIPWSEDYASTKSRKFKTLELTVTAEIEDSYDKYFDGEKLIEAYLEDVHQFQFGILLTLKVCSVYDTVEVRDLQLAMNNAEDFFAHVSKQLENDKSEIGEQSSNENLELDEDLVEFI
jgi:hypothetical protein